MLEYRDIASCIQARPSHFFIHNFLSGYCVKFREWAVHSTPRHYRAMISTLNGRAKGCVFLTVTVVYRAVLHTRFPERVRDTHTSTTSNYYL
jgi:hypothetical protein